MRGGHCPRWKAKAQQSACACVHTAVARAEGQGSGAASCICEWSALNKSVCLCCSSPAGHSSARGAGGRLQKRLHRAAVDKRQAGAGVPQCAQHAVQLTPFPLCQCPEIMYRWHRSYPLGHALSKVKGARVLERLREYAADQGMPRHTLLSTEAVAMQEAPSGDGCLRAPQPKAHNLV